MLCCVYIFSEVQPYRGRNMFHYPKKNIMLARVQCKVSQRVDSLILPVKQLKSTKEMRERQLLWYAYLSTFDRLSLAAINVS